MVQLNDKQETFCRLIAIDRVQPMIAYKAAGYKSGYRSALTALMSRPEIKTRIEELQEHGAPEPVSVRLKDEDEEINLGWCARAYADVLDQALRDKSYNNANAAIAGIRDILTSAQPIQPKDDSDKPRVNIHDLSMMLGKVADVVAAAQGADQPVKRLEAVPIIDADSREV